MKANNKMRPLDIRHDLEAMTDLIEVAFAGDLMNWGSDFRAEMSMAQKMVPLLGFLERISENYRHTFDGFVWEDRSRIVSLVVVQKTGLDATHWQIGNVATHPEYRRQGLARKLVRRAMEHAGAHGAEVCTLEVRAEATPAYNLYRSLGFVHYDSRATLKLEGVPTVGAGQVNGYTLRAMKLGEWQARYDLALRETPQEVQSFLPVKKAAYRVSPLEQLVNPLASRLQRLDIHRWAVEKNGQLVGCASLAASRVPKITHRLRLNLDPRHSEALAEPIVTLALETLQGYPCQNTLTSVRPTCSARLEVLKQYGFVEIDLNHQLGAKLDRGKANSRRKSIDEYHRG